MRQLALIRENIQVLSQSSTHFSFQEINYPHFALFLRRNFLEPSSEASRITNRERRVFNRYERALGYYWRAFPQQFHYNPLVKDLAFFLTCLFEIKSNKDREAILVIWAKISSQESSPYSHLKYYAPGDYRSLLAPRTKTQRLRIAHYLLQMFDKAIISNNTTSSCPNILNEGYYIDFQRFLELFHRYVFMAPKVLNKNDIHLISKIIELQSDNQQLLGNHIHLNKNTISSRLNWFKGNHVLFLRRRIRYDAFGLIPYLLLVQTTNSPFVLRDIEEMRPWILSELIGSNKQQIHHLLIPDTLEGKRLMESLVQDILPPISQKVHLLQILLSHEFFCYNIHIYDLANQQWNVHLNSSNLDCPSPSVIWPFEKSSSKTFQPLSILMRILNYFKIYPTGTQRSACNNLKIGKSTLTQHLKILHHSGIISNLYGLYPFDLPEYASFFISLEQDLLFAELLERVGGRLPIILGSRFVGDFKGVLLDIPFPNRNDIITFLDELQKYNEDILWFQINEHPFASRWLFPLEFWDNKSNQWFIKPQIKNK